MKIGVSVSYQDNFMFLFDLFYGYLLLKFKRRYRNCIYKILFGNFEKFQERIVFVLEEIEINKYI